jgi:phosphatidate cytidylyltransferase
LPLRVLTAAVLGPAALFAIWAGSAAFGAVAALLTIGLSYEWLGLCRKRGSVPAAGLFATLPVAAVLAAAGYYPAALVILVLATLAAAVLTGGVGPSRPLAFGIPYIGTGALALVWLRAPPQSGAANVVVLLLVIWGTDIGAYLVGRLAGGPRLWPSVSPSKTWSGAAGGLLAAGLVAVAAASVLGDHGGEHAGVHAGVHGGFHGISWRPILFAVTTSVIGQAGDLFESRLKRHFGVKDSGKLIPGHGGLMDRLDSVLAAAPAAALLALALGSGVVLWE